MCPNSELRDALNANTQATTALSSRVETWIEIFGASTERRLDGLENRERTSKAVQDFSLGKAAGALFLMMVFSNLLGVGVVIFIG